MHFHSINVFNHIYKLFLRCIFILIYFIFVSEKAIACDICGGSPQLGSNAIGFSHAINQPLIGIQYLHWGYQTKDRTSKNEVYTVLDQIQSLNFHYTQYIHTNWQIQANWGINQITRNNAYNEKGTQSLWGINDINGSLNYKFFDNRSNAFSKNKWIAFVGITAKIPNGFYQVRDNEKRMLPIQLQPGNGCYAIGMQTFIAWKTKNYGIAMQGRLNESFENELGYIPGLNGGLQTGIYYVVDKINTTKQKQWKLIPQIGIKTDFNLEDEQFNQKITETQLNNQQIFSQIEFMGQKTYVNLFFSLPISHNNESNNIVIQPMTRISIAYILRGKDKKTEN